MKTYSHPATRQDEWVLSKSSRPGTFIEIGAHDGKHYSNTLALEEAGWTGILIEPQPDLYVECCKNRPDAVCLDWCIGTGKMESLILGGSYGGIARYMPQEWWNEHRNRGNRVVEVQTRTMTDLAKVFDYEFPAADRPDYLSIDVEGAEFMLLEEYLKAPSWLDARLISVEFRYDTLLLAQMEELLQYRYRLDEVRGFDALFVRK
jgi:FkbM family methyltransferase